MIANTTTTDPGQILPSAILETCLDVTDLNRARDFYSGLFGYAIMKSDERFCAFSVGERQILILRRHARAEKFAGLGLRLPKPSGYGGRVHHRTADHMKIFRKIFRSAAIVLCDH